LFGIGVVVFVRFGKNKKSNIIELSSIGTIDMIPTGDITLKRKLGEGNFGEVYQGDWKGTPVAMKRLKNTNNAKEFYDEANMLWKMKHPNIVQLLGCYTSKDGDCFMILEFAEKGSLEEWIRKKKLSQQEKLQITKELIFAMRYLEGVEVIHRDLAARNILVNKAEQVMISDLGMSRKMDYYRSTGKEIPIRWSAPESLKYRKYSHHSDVWSFGVLMWEVFTDGMLPYYQYSNEEVCNLIVQGTKLEKPIDCTDEIYNIMQSCWALDENDRPAFQKIFERLAQINPSSVIESDSNTMPTISPYSNELSFSVESVVETSKE